MKPSRSSSSAVVRLRQQQLTSLRSPRYLVWPLYTGCGIFNQWISVQLGCALAHLLHRTLVLRLARRHNFAHSGTLSKVDMTIADLFDIDNAHTRVQPYSHADVRESPPHWPTCFLSSVISVDGSDPPDAYRNGRRVLKLADLRCDNEVLVMRSRTQRDPASYSFAQPSSLFWFKCNARASRPQLSSLCAHLRRSIRPKARFVDIAKRARHARTAHVRRGDKMKCAYMRELKSSDIRSAVTSDTWVSTDDESDRVFRGHRRFVDPPAHLNEIERAFVSALTCVYAKSFAGTQGSTFTTFIQHERDESNFSYVHAPLRGHLERRDVDADWSWKRHGLATTETGWFMVHDECFTRSSTTNSSATARDWLTASFAAFTQSKASKASTNDATKSAKVNGAKKKEKEKRKRGSSSTPSKFDGKYHFANAKVFPFKPLVDEANNEVGVVAISAPLYPNRGGQKEWDELERLKRAGTTFVGISSYQEFPLEIKSRHEGRFRGNFFRGQPDVAALCVGWLTCGRDESEHIPPALNPLLLSECDFMTEGSYPDARGQRKQWDFLYYCSSGNWSQHCRNFPLATRHLIPQLLANGMSVVIVGRAKPYNHKDGLPAHPNLTEKPLLAWSKFQQVMKQCRYLFMPNISDAAPRTMVECFWRNIPAVVHRDIHGGWKHIQDKTCVTFSDEHDFWPAVQDLVAKERRGHFEPREYMRAYQARLQPRRLLYDYVQTQIAAHNKSLSKPASAWLSMDTVRRASLNVRKCAEAAQRHAERWADRLRAGITFENSPPPAPARESCSTQESTHSNNYSQAPPVAQVAQVRRGHWLQPRSRPGRRQQCCLWALAIVALIVLLGAITWTLVSRRRRRKHHEEAMLM